MLLALLLAGLVSTEPPPPSFKRLAVEFTLVAIPDWAITEAYVRHPHIEEINVLGQSAPARALISGAFVASAAFLTREAYEVSPRFGRVVRWAFIAYKAVLFALNVRVVASATRR